MLVSALRNKRVTRHGLVYGFLSLLSLVLIASTLVPVERAHAFTPSYNQNNLIDNPTLLNNGTMSASVIQTFLSNTGSGLSGYSDVEACDSTIAPYYSHCGQTISAAQIVYDASQAYGINPRAILATMEKEQSLVTDPSPSASQINCAMGYNSCSNYVGFFTQVDNGTWVLRYNYEGASGHATWLSWSPGANYPCRNASSLYSAGLYPGNTVVFADPGGTAETVTLTNAATASLYCYTPYVGPYWVTGYSGSYNFVYYYQLWFGSTQASIPYAWNYESQSGYANSSHTQALTGIPTVTPGGSLYLQVVGRNVGYQTWSQSNLHLGTSNPDDRTSQFYDSSWINSTRPTGLVEASVAPGDVGTFNFVVHAPSQTGTYNEYFNLVADGITWLGDPGLFFTINVVSPVVSSNAQNTGLSSGQSMSVNQHLLSPDTQSTLVLQGDGNLVLYSDFKPTWASYHFSSRVSYLTMQADGNLVEYDSSNNPIWNSVTGGNPGAYLALQPDGNLVIYSSSNTPLWATHTIGVPDYLSRVVTSLSNASIYINQSLETANRNYQLILQGDGNLVLYHNGTPTWASMTVGKGATTLVMQGDGNLVLYNTSGAPVWATWTNGRGASSLNIQPDGNVVIYNSAGQPTWETYTNGH